MLREYRLLVEQGKIEHSDEQIKVIKEVESCGYPPLTRSFFTHRPYYKGIYLYGEVGRGKSFLMTLYFKHFPGPKLRMHFHDFTGMMRAHISNNIESGISGFVEQLKSNYKLFFLDELHIKDISNAMIVLKFLELIFTNGLFLVATSNYHPSTLYDKGINSQSFAPAVDLIVDNMKVISSKGNVDYRVVCNKELRFIGNDSDIELRKLFEEHIASFAIEEVILDFTGARNITLTKCSKNALWLDFKDFMSNNLGAHDYKVIASRFKFIFLSNIVDFDGNNELHRFIVMIDQFYESGVKLFISSKKELESIVGEYDFERSISRIKAMNV